MQERILAETSRGGESSWRKMYYMPAQADRSALLGLALPCIPEIAQRMTSINLIQHVLNSESEQLAEVLLEALAKACLSPVASMKCCLVWCNGGLRNECAAQPMRSAPNQWPSTVSRNESFFVWQARGCISGLAGQKGRRGAAHEASPAASSPGRPSGGVLGPLHHPHPPLPLLPRGALPSAHINRCTTGASIEPTTQYSCLSANTTSQKHSLARRPVQRPMQIK